MASENIFKLGLEAVNQYIRRSKVLYSIIMFIISYFKTVELFIFRHMSTTLERVLRKEFRRGDIKFNGTRPWDIKVNDKMIFPRISNYGSMGLGETYMEEMWDTDDLVECTSRILRYDCHQLYLTPLNKFINYLHLNFFNLQTKQKAWQVGEEHYDKGNDLFQSFLDPAMNYSCGYWKTAKNLTQAQIDKMDLICKKLSLQPGMTVLDIGCGWGGLCKYMAENYKVSVVGITVSKEGAEYARDYCKGSSVDIQLIDYRDLNGEFDRIVSVGMFEHVGHNNYREFFEVANRCLKDDGIFLLHTIGVSHDHVPLAEPWYHKYIFPNGILPYYKHITDGIEKLFIIEDWHNFGPDYCKTLLAWNENFQRNWPSLESKYGKKFHRMWTYYLKFSAGCFKSRKFQLWQIVLSKNGVLGDYRAAR